MISGSMATACLPCDYSIVDSWTTYKLQGRLYILKGTDQYILVYIVYVVVRDSLLSSSYKPQYESNRNISIPCKFVCALLSQCWLP